MICLHCRNKIAWFKVVLLTRWSNLRCETCGYRWNRDHNRQSFIVDTTAILMAMPTAFIADIKGISVGLLYLSAVLVLASFIDAKTIRLVSPAVRKTNKLE